MIDKKISLFEMIDICDAVGKKLKEALDNNEPQEVTDILKDKFYKLSWCYEYFFFDDGETENDTASSFYFIYLENKHLFKETTDVCITYRRVLEALMFYEDLLRDHDITSELTIYGHESVETQSKEAQSLIDGFNVLWYGFVYLFFGEEVEAGRLALQEYIKDKDELETANDDKIN